MPPEIGVAIPAPSRLAETRHPLLPLAQENHSLPPAMTRLVGAGYGAVEKRLVSVRVCVSISLIAVAAWSATYSVWVAPFRVIWDAPPSPVIVFTTWPA